MKIVDKAQLAENLHKLANLLEHAHEDTLQVIENRVNALISVAQATRDNKEPGPLPEHHKQWFNQMLLAASNNDVALMSCLDAGTNEVRSVICLVGFDAKTQEYLFTPIGHLCPEGNPFDAYGPPGDILNDPQPEQS